MWKRNAANHRGNKQQVRMMRHSYAPTDMYFTFFFLLHFTGLEPKYLTTVIPYHMDSGPPNNQGLQVIIKSKFCSKVHPFFLDMQTRTIGGLDSIHIPNSISDRVGRLLLKMAKWQPLASHSFLVTE